MNLNSASWLCLDTETTGLDPTTDRIIEIGAVQFSGGSVGWQMGTLVDPGILIKEAASKVNGITDEMVKGCQTIDEAIELLASAISHADVLVAYNWPFDASFFSAQIGPSTWERMLEGKAIIDPLVVVRSPKVGKFWKGKGRHKLNEAARRLGIEREGDAHRAVSDCVLTCRVLWALLEYLPEDAHEAAAAIVKMREQQNADRAAWLETKK